jgi:hypothetical protein
LEERIAKLEARLFSDVLAGDSVRATAIQLNALRTLLPK